MDQRTIVSKADLAVADLVSTGGYLQLDQVQTFMRMVQNEPTILKQARRVDMKSHTREVNKIGFGSRILHAAPSEGQYLDAAKRGKPTTGQIMLTTSKMMAEVHMTYESLEDNIERGNLNQVIMEEMAKQVAIDLEEIFLLGDTTSSDPDLALMDGILKKASNHIVDAGSASISKDVFLAGIKAMPHKYLRVRPNFRFWLSHNKEADYINTLANRIGDKADARVEGYTNSYAYGVPVEPAAMIPDAQCLFTHPQNLLWGVWRDIMVETDKDIRNQTYIIVLTLRAGIQIEEADAVVKITNLAA